MIDIGTLLHNQSDKKTINMKNEPMKFIDEKNIIGKSLEGVRVTYKRKLVVKKFAKANETLGIFSENN